MTSLRRPKNISGNLIGLIEIAQMAGVKRPVVTQWRTRPMAIPFPEPVAQLHVGPVFWRPEVEVWLFDTGRRSDAGLTRDQVRDSRPFPRP